MTAGPAAQQAERPQAEPDRLAEHVQRLVDQAPPLSAEQKSRLALLLRPSVTS